jgi:hypothetical protein
MVLADGLPLKSCAELVKPGSARAARRRLPKCPQPTMCPDMGEVMEMDVRC